MEVSRQEYWSGLPFPAPGDLPHPGIKPSFLALTGRFFSHCAIWEVPNFHITPSLSRSPSWLGVAMDLALHQWKVHQGDT